MKIVLEFDSIEELESFQKRVFITNAQVSALKGSSLDEIDFTVRTSNCLKSQDINTIADLLSKTEQELISIPNFGRHSLREVREKLSRFGLKLGTPL